MLSYSNEMPAGAIDRPWPGLPTSTLAVVSLSLRPLTRATAMTAAAMAADTPSRTARRVLSAERVTVYSPASCRRPHLEVCRARPLGYEDGPPGSARSSTTRALSDVSPSRVTALTYMSYRCVGCTGTVGLRLPLACGTGKDSVVGGAPSSGELSVTARPVTRLSPAL